jgi:hypothetical protein
LTARSVALARTIWTAVGGTPCAVDRVGFITPGAVPSAFPVAATAPLAIAELVSQTGPAYPSIAVDRGLSGIWFKASIRPVGWSPPPAWDPFAGDYPTCDGWIRLHTNAPHHRVAADVGLDAYGWHRLWATRRSFASLVQMSTGIAEAGMRCERCAAADTAAVPGDRLS